MKALCCDTSFLLSWYGHDDNSLSALSFLRTLRRPIILSVFNLFEFEHATHFKVWHKMLSKTEAAGSLTNFQQDLELGRLRVDPAHPASIISEARRLTASFTERKGYRSFDILHVAAALSLGAEEFLSFDTKQRDLAQTQGLSVRP